MKTKLSLIKLKPLCSALTICLLWLCSGLPVQAQAQKSPKVNDIFFEFVSKELSLTPAQAADIRPLIKQYLMERGKTSRNFRDPLEREQQILSLKMKYRARMAKVVGKQKATRFFTSEQSFRRKVKDVLRAREEQAKKPSSP